jgi:hypothetical protein
MQDRVTDHSNTKHSHFILDPCCACCVNAKMGAHSKPPSNSTRAHFSEAQHEQACSHFRAAFKRRRGSSPTEDDTRTAKPGRAGDPVWREAWESFQSGQRRQEHKLLTTARQYKDLVRTWYSRWDQAKPCRRVGIGRDCPLSANEIEFAVRVLGSPLQDGENNIYFESVSDCIARTELGDKLQVLLDKKRMRPDQLFRLLVHDLGLLKYETCDTRDELPLDTLKKRRDCSDIWAHRIHWLTTPSTTRQGDPVKHFFQWSWYFDLTFMIDAVSFEDGIRSASKKQRRVLKAVGKVYAPQMQKRKKGIDRTSNMMFYVVIHRRGGIVAGPALFYTGSKVPQSKAPQKATILEPWCGHTQHQFRCETF